MYILCVTSCPVGIAHTFMAAANLNKACKKRNIDVKIETQGAQGIENNITEEDVKKADACVVASDVRIRGLNRFDSLPTLEIGVGEACKDADSVIEELLEAIK